MCAVKFRDCNLDQARERASDPLRVKSPKRVALWYCSSADLNDCNSLHQVLIAHCSVSGSSIMAGMQQPPSDSHSAIGLDGMYGPTDVTLTGQVQRDHPLRVVVSRTLWCTATERLPRLFESPSGNLLSKKDKGGGGGRVKSLRVSVRQTSAWSHLCTREMKGGGLIEDGRWEIALSSIV